MYNDKTKPEPIYVAFDSDILSELAILYTDEINNRTTNVTRTAKDPLLREYGGYINRIYELIKEDLIRPVILNTIYNECTLVKFIEPFIIKHGYFPDYNLTNKTKKRNESKRLAQLYCEPYIHQGVEYPAPMKIEYSAHDDSRRPQNDAYAMAEATIENCLFVTANEKDFISTRNEENRNSRAMGVLNINLQQGYYETNKYGKQIIPKPMSIKTFGALIKDIRIFETPTPKRVVKADIFDTM